MCGKIKRINNFTILSCMLLETLVLPVGISLSQFLLDQAGFREKMKTRKMIDCFEFEFLRVENLFDLDEKVKDEH